MKLWLAALLVLSTSASFAQDNPPVIPFNSVPNPLRLPENMYFGEVSGVAVNSKGHVFVLSRGNTTGPAYAAAATQLLESDANGKYIRETGKNLSAWSFAHTVKVDPQDNIWVTVKGSDMVIKFSPEGSRQVRGLIDYYLTNAAYVRQAFQRMGFDCVGGDNSPYIWVRSERDSWAFFDFLLKQAGVVCTPGAGFGRCGENHIRISAFNSFENVQKAMQRIADALK